MEKRGPSQRPLHAPTTPPRAEEKPSLKKEKGERGGELKRKATNYINDKWKTNYIKNIGNLISARMGALIKISSLQKSSQHRPGIRWLPRGDEKLRPPSSNLERGHQTRVVPGKPAAISKRMGRCDGNQVPLNGIDFEQGKGRKKLDKR